MCELIDFHVSEFTDTTSSLMVNPAGFPRPDPNRLSSRIALEYDYFTATGL